LPSFINTSVDRQDTARDSLRPRFFPLTMRQRDWAASAEVKIRQRKEKKEISREK
jgi:hypothetical protein